MNLRTGIKILIVDDDPMVVQSCRRVLEEEGFAIQTASSVASASAILTEKDFDLMITDINMPGKNGFAMIAEAKAMRPEMPILVMTGYLTAETAGKCRHLGANHHLAKPFTPTELMAAIGDTQNRPSTLTPHS